MSCLAIKCHVTVSTKNPIHNTISLFACCFGGWLISVALLGYPSTSEPSSHGSLPGPGLQHNLCAQRLSPRTECSRHCNLLGQEVVGLEIKIFVRVCHLSMDCSWEGPIRMVCNHSIQECKFAIFFWFKMNWMEASIELRWRWKAGTWSG